MFIGTFRSYHIAKRNVSVVFFSRLNLKFIKGKTLFAILFKSPIRNSYPVLQLLISPICIPFPFVVLFEIPAIINIHRTYLKVHLFEHHKFYIIYLIARL